MPQRRQRSPSKCRPRNKEVAISRSRLDEDAILVCCGRKMKIVYVCGYRYQVSPESCPPPCFLPREPPGQAMALARGCCCWGVLSRLNRLHRVQPCRMLYIVHTPVRLPASIATLTAPTTARLSRCLLFVPVRSGRSFVLNMLFLCLT